MGSTFRFCRQYADAGITENFQNACNHKLLRNSKTLQVELVELCLDRFLGITKLLLDDAIKLVQ